MGAKTGPNDAVKFRTVRREIKKGFERSRLTYSLGDIGDPYFRSQSRMLFILNGWEADPDEIIQEAGTVEPLWRRAEVLSELMKMSDRLEGDAKGYFQESITEMVLGFPGGKDLSEVTKRCAPRLPCHALPGMLRRIVSNRGFELEDSKVIIRTWATGCPGDPSILGEISGILKGIGSPRIRALTLGYLHIQLLRDRSREPDHDVFKEAVDAAMKCGKEDRTGCLSYLCSNAGSTEFLDFISTGAADLEDTGDRVKVLSYLSSARDRLGERETALDLIEKAASDTKRCTDEALRRELEAHLARDMERLHAGGGRKLPQEDNEKKKEAQKKIQNRTGSEKIQTPVRRHILGLYDSYEGAVKQTHIRALSRAAPLCYGFDLDLALIGFPTEDLGALVKKASKETNIGEGGRYLRALFERGRIHLIHTEMNGVPVRIDKGWLPVATTSRPDPEKTLRQMEEGGVPGGSNRYRLLLIMGLGKQGLPKTVLNWVEYHMELTGRNIPLETATAMGIIAYRLSILDH
ncbi:MAG: DUF531 family protein [Thermoplasmatota archaeon]